MAHHHHCRRGVGGDGICKGRSPRRRARRSSRATPPTRQKSKNNTLSHCMPAVPSLSSSIVMLCSSPAKSLSDVRKSMQWHSLRSRMGTQGQFPVGGEEWGRNESVWRIGRKKARARTKKKKQKLTVAVGGLGLLVVVVAARAERRAQGVFVLGEPLDDDSGDGLVDAEKCPGAVGFCFCWVEGREVRRTAARAGGARGKADDGACRNSPLRVLLAKLAHDLEVLGDGLGRGGVGCCWCGERRRRM